MLIVVRCRMNYQGFLKEFIKFSLETQVHYTDLCAAEEKLAAAVRQTDKDKSEFDKLLREFHATDGPDVFKWRAKLAKTMLNCRTQVGQRLAQIAD